MILRLSAAAQVAGLILPGCTGSGSRPERLECALDSAALGEIARKGGAGAETVRAPGRASEPELIRQPLTVGGQPRVVVGVSWGGPANGVLIVADCDGKVLDVEHSGYVRELRVLTGAAGQARLRVDAVTGTDGGRQERFELFALTPAGLRRAWSGVKFEASHPAPSAGAYELAGTLVQLAPDTLVHRVARHPLVLTEWGDRVRRNDADAVREDTLVWTGDTVVAVVP